MTGPRTSWQTLLADLSLVLFMVTAGALGRARLERRALAVAPAASPAGPLAVYRDDPGAPPLAAWLARQPHDARQQLTIVARYAPGSEPDMPARVAALLAAANSAGTHPRIVIEPGGGGISAGVGFDTPPEPSARALPITLRDSPNGTMP